MLTIVPPPRVAHLARTRARQEERPADVRGDHLVELVVGHLEQRPVAHAPGVVDQHVEAAERAERGADRAAGELRVAHIARHGDRVGQLVGELAQRRLAARGDHEPRTGRGQRAGVGGAEPGRRAGDHDHAAVEGGGAAHGATA